jgi:hypothetical protein
LASEEVLVALRDVLLNKIYPLNAALVRNDAKSARLVVAYVKEMRQLHEQHFGRDLNKISRSQREMVFAYFLLSPISGRSESTIRKYINELWLNGWFEGCIQFGDVNNPGP